MDLTQETLVHFLFGFYDGPLLVSCWVHFLFFFSCWLGAQVSHPNFLHLGFRDGCSSNGQSAGLLPSLDSLLGATWIPQVVVVVVVGGRFSFVQLGLSSLLLTRAKLVIVWKKKHLRLTKMSRLCSHETILRTESHSWRKQTGFNRKLWGEQNWRTFSAMKIFVVTNFS